MVSKKAQTEAKNSDAGMLAEKGYKPAEIARILRTSPAKVYRTLEVAEGIDPTPYKGSER